ncbi:MAG: TIGR03936 family radical SAM-associated protein [Bacillota bacterium]
MRLRVRLSKTGLARFFSHLDLQRTLERSLRRAGLPIAYSQGFNPHPRISFASALATGTSSDGEFIDVELVEPMDPAEFVAQANAACPQGLRLLEARVAPDGKGDSLQALLNAAEYRITLAGAEPGPLRSAVEALLAAELLEVTKEGRTGPRPVNIRPQVYALELTGPAELRALVQTGPQGNLKPEDLIAGLRTLAPGLEGLEITGTHRLMLYRRDLETGALVEPWSL